MQYAYLQLGQDAKARALMMEAGAVNKVFRAILGSETGLAAVPARYMLERQDWRGAAGLQIPAAVNAPPAKAIIHFARALGAARSGDLAAAQTDIGNLQELKAALEQTNQPYWAGQVDVQMLADLLMEQNQPAAALPEYETSMKSTPERLREFYGAARAAAATGD